MSLGTHFTPLFFFQVARQSAAAAAAKHAADEAALVAAERARLEAEAAAAEDAKLKAAGPRLVGDGGAAWRRKALLRATEQAKEAGVSVEEFVKDRWGVRVWLVCALGHLCVFRVKIWLSACFSCRVIMIVVLSVTNSTL